MQARCSARLKKEAEDITKNYANVLELQIKDDNMSCWHIKFTGAEGSVYQGENYTLQFKFNSEYVSCKIYIQWKCHMDELSHFESNVSRKRCCDGRRRKRVRDGVLHRSYEFV